ncbi:MAG: hypothetical protein M2R45_00910 [Verrucomicrobia subdivision 3 bacterium]|nr:hypothetical protein [Limisphaerales bacterium]MCS1414579.1 hypothetical protein [Limisphaerales bacterium]
MRPAPGKAETLPKHYQQISQLNLMHGSKQLLAQTTPRINNLETSHNLCPPGRTNQPLKLTLAPPPKPRNEAPNRMSILQKPPTLALQDDGATT